MLYQKKEREEKMIIKNEFPPNYALIKQAGLSDKNTIFCYGDIIYNPYQKEIPDDVMFHESIHANQQKQWTSPEIWWNKYILDKSFRQEMELQAYSAQYQLIRKTHTTEAAKECLEECARNLSSKVYNLGISYHQAFTKIRHKTKELWQN